MRDEDRALLKEDADYIQGVAHGSCGPDRLQEVANRLLALAEAGERTEPPAPSREELEMALDPEAVRRWESDHHLDDAGVEDFAAHLRALLARHKEPRDGR